MNAISEDTREAERIRVVMVGDFPRRDDRIAGGVESVMLYLGRALARREDLDLQVVTLDRWGDGERHVDCRGFTAHYVPSVAVRGPLQRILNTRRLSREIRNLEPEVVHAHIAGQYSTAAQATGLPMLLTLHGIRFLEANLRAGFLDRYYRRHVIRAEEARAIRGSRHLISINPFIDETFEDQIAGEVTHIENPVADIWFSVDEPEINLNLLYAGRITPRKDLLTLLRAFRDFHSRYPEARLRIAGAPDRPDRAGYFDSLERFLRENDLEQSVSFLGNLSEQDLLSEYGRNAFFVLSAVLETAPMSIGQAQAAGRIVITTDAGGCRHMVEDGVSGLVVPVGDSKRFCEALLACAENEALCQSMSRAARRVARERYQADAIAERTAVLYHRIVEGSRGQ